MGKRGAESKLKPGMVFGKWTLLKEVIPGRIGEWHCECICGAVERVKRCVFYVSAAAGCKDCKAGYMYRTPAKHGLSRFPNYSRWMSMVSRCYDEKSHSYHNYGQRGIEVCDRWRHGDGGLDGFNCFLVDMGFPPEGAKLDRIDPDGNYEKSNCQWLDASSHATKSGLERNRPFKRYGRPAPDAQPESA